MAISLKKGENTNLSNAAPGMTKMAVGLGWNARATAGEEFDLDASAFMLNEGDKVSSDTHFIFYNQDASPEGSVKYMGDNRTGDGDGDDDLGVCHYSQCSRAESELWSSVRSIYSLRGCIDRQ